MGMFSPWAILLYVGALHAALVVLLSVPLPRWISTRLLALTEKLFYYQLVLVALCLIAAGTSYHAFTVKHPLPSLNENLNNQNYQMLLGSHFRDQRNFYIVIFCTVVTICSLSLSSMRNKLLRAENELERRRAHAD